MSWCNICASASIVLLVIKNYQLHQNSSSYTLITDMVYAFESCTVDRARCVHMHAYIAHYTYYKAASATPTE